MEVFSTLQSIGHVYIIKKYISRLDGPLAGIYEGQKATNIAIAIIGSPRRGQGT